MAVQLPTEEEEEGDTLVVEVVYGHIQAEQIGAMVGVAVPIIQVPIRTIQLEQILGMERLLSLFCLNRLQMHLQFCSIRSANKNNRRGYQCIVVVK